MAKLIDSLLADHKMIRKLLDGLEPENPRFGEMAKTLERVVHTHARFEDDLVAPLAKEIPVIQPILTDEIVREHQDIAALLTIVRGIDINQKDELKNGILQLKAVLGTHFAKEEDAWFPLLEKYAPAEKLAKTGGAKSNS